MLLFEKPVNITCFILFLFKVFASGRTQSNNDYWTRRAEFVHNEINMQIGSEIKLNDKEEIVNNHLMEAKFKEFDAGMRNPSEFLPAMNFLTAQPLIEQSDVFKIIKKMPKGAVLHGHDNALASEEFIYNLTFTPNLYFCNTSSGSVRFIFSDTNPNNFNKQRLELLRKTVRIRMDDKCTEWKLLEDERKASKDVDKLNNFIRSKLTLRIDNPDEVYTNVNIVWNKFRDVFSTIIPILTYRPVLQKYWYQVFQEHYDDNIMYMEFRGTLPPAYELNGTTYNEIQVAGMYRKIMKQFMLDHPDFIGSKFIYAPFRGVNNDTVDTYLTIMEKLHAKYPDFIAGFDLVGQEDLGEPLVSFVEKLARLQQDNIKLFFHSGETNWYGMTDLNLIDAILLGTTRIGHGFAIDKHPLVSQTIKDDQIAVEICPISNQVLCLVKDLRNHPAAAMIANNYPVVIGNDDPAFWGAKGLSYDFYEAFMAFTSREADIRVLKQLALNSIKYSAMSFEEQSIAVNVFNRKWNKFIDSLITRENLNEIPTSTEDM